MVFAVLNIEVSNLEGKIRSIIIQDTTNVNVVNVLVSFMVLCWKIVK